MLEHLGRVDTETGEDLRRYSTTQGNLCTTPYLCSGIAADSQGNLCVTDTSNHRIRKISVDGSVSTVAGTGKQGHRDGKVEEARFGRCIGLAIGEDDTIYVADSFNCVIRRIKDGVVSTFAGKAGVRKSSN